MPVAPAFNPTTGASGGAPPAASASLANLPLTVVDLTDGSWTLEDPDNLVASVTHAGGDNIVTWNALAAGSADYNWSGGTNHRAPRWYKLLDIDGTQVVVPTTWRLRRACRITPALTTSTSRSLSAQPSTRPAP